MSDSLALQERFEQVLLEVRQNLQAFLSCLEQEREVLEQNDLALIEQSIANKQNMMSSLQNVSHQCQEILQTSHLNFTDTSISKFIKLYPIHKQDLISQLWRDIKGLTSLAHQYNMRNGLIINMLKNHNDSLLKLMVKQAPPTDYTDLNRTSRVSISTREHKA